MPKFCSSCGSSVPDAARFCNKCGAKLAPTQPAGAQGASEPPPAYDPTPRSKQYDPPPPSSYNPSGYQSPMPYNDSPSASSGLQRNVAGMLCYILGLVTGIVFLVITPYNKDRFIRFHAFQAIFFHVGIIAIWIVLGILDAILGFGLGFIVTLAQLVVWLGGLALWIFLMVKAYGNEKYKLPVIGDLAEKQAG